MENMQNNSWHSAEIYAKQIIAKGEKATLVQMPFDGKYKDYKFWMTNKLVRENPRNKNLASVSFTDDFRVTVFKEAKGEDGKYVATDKVELSASEFAEALAANDAKIKEYRETKKAERAEKSEVGQEPTEDIANAEFEEPSEDYPFN